MRIFSLFTSSSLKRFFLSLIFMVSQSAWAIDLNKLVSETLKKATEPIVTGEYVESTTKGQQIRSKTFRNLYSNVTLEQEIDRWMATVPEADSEIQVNLEQLRQATREHLNDLFSNRLKDRDFLRIHQLTACYDLPRRGPPVLKAVYGRLSDSIAEQLFSVHHFVLDVAGNGYYTMGDGGITQYPKLANFRLTVESLCLLSKTVALRAPYAGVNGLPDLNAYQGLNADQREFITRSISDLVSNRTGEVDNSRWHRLALCHDQSGKISAVVGMYNDYSLGAQKGRNLYESGIFYFTAAPGKKNNSIRQVYKHPEYGEADRAISKLCVSNQVIL